MATSQSTPSPAFQFYPREFVGDLDVAAMTMEEAGCYTILLCHAWLKGGLPNDHARLAKALHVSRGKFSRLWTVVGEKFFVDTDGRLKNERQEEVRRDQAEHRAERSESGRKGNIARWKGHRTAIAEPSLSESLSDESDIAKHRSSPSPSSSPAVQTPPVSVGPQTVPLGVRARIDVAWPGRPPVPGTLHADFRLKLGGDPNEADARLSAWYPTVAAAWADRPIGDNDFVFWRARFQEWVGTTVSPVSAKQATRDAVRAAFLNRHKGAAS